MHTRRRGRRVIETEVCKAEYGDYHYRERNKKQIGPTLAPFCAGLVNYRAHHRVVDCVPHAGDSHNDADCERGDKNGKLKIVGQRGADYVIEYVLTGQTNIVHRTLFFCVSFERSSLRCIVCHIFIPPYFMQQLYTFISDVTIDFLVILPKKLAPGV